MPPPVRHVDRAALDDLDDQESLAKTVERKSVRITTARFASVAPCAIDVVAAPSSPPSPPPSSSSSLPWTSLPSALLRHPRAAIGAALWLACVIAGITGVLLGHARPSRAHAAQATVAAQTARTPRAAVIVEAGEEITQLPILAPGKEIESPAPEASAAPARPLRRSGFGHMGADRVASGAAARRAAPHRH